MKLRLFTAELSAVIHTMRDFFLNDSIVSWPDVVVVSCLLNFDMEHDITLLTEKIFPIEARDDVGSWEVSLLAERNSKFHFLPLHVLNQ